MKAKLLSKEWEKLIEEDLPKIELKKGDVSWILELLGWGKDVKRGK